MMSEPRETGPRDVAIAGSGLTGSLLALALVHAGKPRLSVVLAGRAGAEADDPRAYAIAPGVRRMLEVLGVWARVEAEACPVAEMRITDSRLEDLVRPVLLSLGAEAGGGEPVAHIVPASALARATSAALADKGVAPYDIGTFESVETDAATAVLHGTGGSVEARLLVGADGLNSVVRESAGIRSFGWSYGQHGVVATLAAELPHEGVAVQHFLPGGPFALLPMTGDRYSLVWSLPERRAREIAALEDAGFAAAVEEAAGAEIGALALAGPRGSFPLSLSLARNFVAPRIALAGDAAHRLHPLAGQGQNMGLRDVAALAQVVLDAARLGEDPGSLSVLKRYERWRRFDTVQLAAATDALNRLFSADESVLRGLRDFGLGVVNRASGLKTFIMRDAAGETGETPRLLDGLPA